VLEPFQPWWPHCQRQLCLSEAAAAARLQVAIVRQAAADVRDGHPTADEAAVYLREEGAGVLCRLGCADLANLAKRAGAGDSGALVALLAALAPKARLEPTQGDSGALSVGDRGRPRF
jgi:hypothetical protein